MEASTYTFGTCTNQYAICVRYKELHAGSLHLEAQDTVPTSIV